MIDLDYLYSAVREFGPDGAGVHHYHASRRRVERSTPSTVTLAPMETISWTCHTPPLEGWRPATHPGWRMQRRVRQTPRARRFAAEQGAVLLIDDECWYYASPPEIPTEIVPLDKLLGRITPGLVRHRDRCEARGYPVPDVEAQIRQYTDAVIEHRRNMEVAA